MQTYFDVAEKTRAPQALQRRKPVVAIRETAPGSFLLLEMGGKGRVDMVFDTIESCIQQVMHTFPGATVHVRD